MKSECCDAEVRYRYCAKCGQECRVRNDLTLTDLVKRWREEANELSKLNRLGSYPDQATRVRQHMVLVTLRRCAAALQKASQELNAEQEK
jgi:hypothetical protein